MTKWRAGSARPQPVNVCGSTRGHPALPGAGNLAAVAQALAAGRGTVAPGGYKRLDVGVVTDGDMPEAANEGLVSLLLPSSVLMEG